jgi:hypothetical protein
MITSLVSKKKYVRLYDLSKKLGMDHNRILDILAGRGIILSRKSPNQFLSQEHVDSIKDLFTQELLTIQKEIVDKRESIPNKKLNWYHKLFRMFVNSEDYEAERNLLVINSKLLLLNSYELTEVGSFTNILELRKQIYVPCEPDVFSIRLDKDLISQYFYRLVFSNIEPAFYINKLLARLKVNLNSNFFDLRAKIQRLIKIIAMHYVVSDEEHSRAIYSNVNSWLYCTNNVHIDAKKDLFIPKGITRYANNSKK